MTNQLQRSNPENGGPTRAEQRKQRLLEAETELAREEAEALKMTEEQRQTLFEPFAAVKAEFSDLDGQRWTQSALRKFQSSIWRPVTPATASAHNSPLSKNTFLVIGSLDSPPSSDATIRVTSPKFGSFKSSTQLSPFQYRKRDGTRSRSPIKGLFSSRSAKLETEPPTSVQIAVVEADITDASDDSGIDEDTVYISRHSATSRTARLRSAGPPGLTPPHETLVSSLAPTTKGHKGSLSFMSAKDFPETPTPTRIIANYKQSHPDVPFPHRNAPLPPSQQPASIPSIAISAPATSLDTPTVRAPCLQGTDIGSLSTIKLKPSQPRSTARTRLQSLLKDVRHGRISASIPSSPIPRPIRSTSHPPPLELSGSPESRDLTDLDLLLDDDDITPRPSPTAAQCQVPMIPQVRSFSQ